MQEKFRLIAEHIATLAGTPWAFLTALFLVILWMISGPMFGFSDTWQLVINTGTTIITFLMVFLIQNAQNRDTVAVQLKLDELLRSVKGARIGMINIDELSDEDLKRLREHFKMLGEESDGELSATVETEANVNMKSRTSVNSKDGRSGSQREESTIKKQVTTALQRTGDKTANTGSSQ